MVCSECASADDSCLSCAVTNGDLKLVKRLLAKEVNLRALWSGKGMLLHLAIMECHIGIVKELIEHGSDIECRDMRGYSPLHLAAERGHLEMVNLLIDRGSDLNAMSTLGDSPLHLSIVEGHTEVARVLIERGSDIESRVGLGCILSRLAEAESGDLDLINLLMNCGTVFEFYNRQMAVECTYFDLEMLIDKGSDIKAATLFAKHFPLQLAIKRGHIEVARMLIEHGSDISTAPGC